MVTAWLDFRNFLWGGDIFGIFSRGISESSYHCKNCLKCSLRDIFWILNWKNIPKYPPPQSENVWMYQDWSGLLLNKKIIVRSLLDDFLSYLKVPLHFFRKSVRAHGFLRWRSDWNSWKNHGFWSTDFIQTEILMHWR